MSDFSRLNHIIINVPFVTEHRKNYPHMHQPFKIGSKSMKRRNSQNTSQQPEPLQQYQIPLSKDKVPKKKSSIPNDSTSDNSDPLSKTNVLSPSSTTTNSPTLEKSAPSTTTLRSTSLKAGDSDTGKFSSHISYIFIQFNFISSFLNFHLYL